MRGGMGNRTIPESTRIFSKGFLGGGNSNIFGIFTPKLGEDEPILTSIFFKWGWVGSDPYRDGSRMVMHSARFPFFFKFWSNITGRSTL